MHFQDFSRMARKKAKCKLKILDNLVFKCKNCSKKDVMYVKTLKRLKFQKFMSEKIQNFKHVARC